MAQNPLAEVFGFPTDDLSPEAKRYKINKLCPFNNKSPNCTKDKANDPLGVCSVMEGNTPAITCPIRFRQDWLIAEDAARFFGFSSGSWTSLPEVRLTDKNGRSAGNIDVVIASYDEKGQVNDFGSLEVQAVYISGNVRRPFEHYIADMERRKNMVWSDTNVRPDYLSSSRKRLLPQMVYKGGILKAWGKKQAIAIHKNFFATLPAPPTVSREEAEVAWMIYDLKKDEDTNRYNLVLDEIVYTEFEPALVKITSPEAGPIEDFVEVLQGKLNEELDNPPDAPTMGDIISS